ncbi:hypothetical protein DLJ49_06055 [Rhodovulum sp. 12E13]|nr:hypothetical protein DLJ49_06055 [Rhodovulum sp. 12E13]
MVAAGAVVTRDVAPLHHRRRPARPLRRRQPPDIAARLVVLPWWDWEHERLRAALGDFRALSAEAFLEKHAG